MYCYCFSCLFVGFPQSLRLDIIMFMSLPIFFVTLFHYCSIKSDLLFWLLNITKASKQHTCVLSRSFLRQVHGLWNRCTFSLANSLDGRFISRYCVSLIGFGLRPSRELIWHLGTQVNNGLLGVYITVLNRGRVSVCASSPFCFTLWSIRVLLVTSRPWLP